MPYIHPVEALRLKFIAASPAFEAQAAQDAAQFPRRELSVVPHLHTAHLDGWIELFMPEMARHALPLASRDDADYQDGIGDAILLLIERLSPEPAFLLKPVYDRKKGNLVDYMERTFAGVRKEHRKKGQTGETSLDAIMDCGEGSEPIEPALNPAYDDDALVLDLTDLLAALTGLDTDSYAARLSFTALRPGTWAFPILRAWAENTVEFDTLPVEPTEAEIKYGSVLTTRNLYLMPTGTPESRQTFSRIMRVATCKPFVWTKDASGQRVLAVKPKLAKPVQLKGQLVDLRSAFGFADDEDHQANDLSWAYDFGERESPFTSRDDDAVIKTYLRTYEHYKGIVRLHDKRATVHARDEAKTTGVRFTKRVLVASSTVYTEYENREIIDQPDGELDVIIDHQDVVGALYAPPSARGFESLYQAYQAQADYVRHIQWLATQRVGTIIVGDVVPGKGLRDVKGTVIPMKWAADRACAFKPAGGNVAAMVALIAAECKGDAHAAKFCQRQVAALAVS